MSYCVRCGKKLEDDSGLCEDCRKQQQNQTTEIAHSEVTVNQVTATEEQPSGRMDGFGRALTSVILSHACMAISLVLFWVVTLKEGFCLLLLLGSIAPQIISLVFGIKSINVFKRNKREGNAKPVATLVLGIVGTIGGAVGIYLWVVFIFLLSLISLIPSTYGLTAIVAVGLI